MKDLVASFEKFLKDKYPDNCMSCWGEGRLQFKGIFIKNGSVQCPTCKGTGKKKG